MIPKIIHYTWFSGEPFPEKIKACIDSWHNLLPDYQFVHWDMDSIKDLDVPFLKEALAEKKWAFASDYVRLWAIYNYGGIYLDTDVMVYESFDDLLSLPFFIGRENSWHFEGHKTVCYLSSHCFGGEKGHLYLKETLDYYNSIHFIRTSNKNVPHFLRLDMTIEPYIQAVFARKYGFDWNYSRRARQDISEGISVFPSECFDATSAPFDGKKYCKHLATGSWREFAMYNPEITWKYKVEWRVVKYIQKFLNRMGYTVVKLT